MENIDVYRIWAPDDSVWSAWAKPVLFAALNANDLSPLRLPPLPDFLPLPDEPQPSVAVIIDLPAEESVLTGLTLARRGYRPVPLYNGAKDSGMIVNTEAIAAALCDGASFLKSCRIAPSAPPAFLLDSNRRTGGHLVQPGRFDNRWCIVPQDMPSADRLAQEGITTVCVFTASVQDDMAHVLHRYQERGLKLFVLRSGGEKLEPLNVPRPSQFRSIWYRLGVFAGFRRNAAGGFGSVIPVPSTHAGG